MTDDHHRVDVAKAASPVELTPAEPARIPVTV